MSDTENIEEKDIDDNAGDDGGSMDAGVESVSSDIGNDSGFSDAGGESVSSNIVDDSGASDIDGESISSDIGDNNDGLSNIVDDDGAAVINEDSESADVDARSIMEALIFASRETLTPAKLKTLIPGAPDAKRLRKMAAEINERLESENHPFEIVEAGGGYQFRTLALYHPWVRKLHGERADRKLSLQALECLAIIAYRQPISKAEVESVRGVLSDGAMKTLLEKKLVDICGRSEKPGRPLLYATTNDFLRYFGINKLADLPRMEEFEALARAQMEEMSTEELDVGN